MASYLVKDFECAVVGYDAGGSGATRCKPLRLPPLAFSPWPNLSRKTEEHSEGLDDQHDSTLAELNSSMKIFT